METREGTLMAVYYITIYERIDGVPRFECTEYCGKTKEYVVLIPVIDGGACLINELKRASDCHVSDYADMVICDEGTKYTSSQEAILRNLGVNSLLLKRDVGKQGAKLRMGLWWALDRGYKGIITIDGNNMNSIEGVPKFIYKLAEGYDFVQGSRFINGRKRIAIHTSIISMMAHYKFTDATNTFRAYSSQFLCDKRVQPFREIFATDELLTYLPVKADQIGLRVCEIPVDRVNVDEKEKCRWAILLKNMIGIYNPDFNRRR